MFSLRRLSLIFTALSLLAFALPSSLLAAPADQLSHPAPPFPAGARFVPNEVLIQFRASASEADKASARSLAGANEQELIRSVGTAGKGDLELDSLPTGLAVADAVRNLQSHPAVVFAEPNWIYTHQVTSNDPYYTNGSLWGMEGDASSPANQYGSQASEAWAAGFTGSSNVYVGVIDEGIQYTHPDLSANVWTNTYDPPDGIDNDGNGYVDDIHGWDFNGNNNTIYDGTSDDHGTHVTGTIGAVGGNGAGVAGVNWNVTIISAKFLGPSGGTTANAIKAVDYVTDLKTRHGLNIVATSNSWGGGGYSQGLYDAIDRAGAASILFVAAAGNNGTNNDSSAFYPASYSNANLIAVAAIESSGSLASFSNYGASSVDLGAPGVGISSTLPDKTYGSYSGTSMATPHVSGAAALYASTHPGATAAAIKQAILGSVAPTTSLTGKTVSGGRLDVGALTGSGSVTPVPDFSLTATPASQAVTQGSGTSYTATLTAANGYSSAVDLTLTGLPSGATAGFNPTPVTPTTAGATSTLSVTTATSTPTGTYTLTVTGTGTDAAATKHSTTVSLVVNAAAAPITSTHDVGVTTLSGPTSVSRGSNAFYRVTVQNFGSATESFNVTLKDGSSTTLNTRSVGGLAPGASTTLNMKWSVSSSTATGPHTITAATALSGDANSANDTRSQTVNVN